MDAIFMLKRALLHGAWANAAVLDTLERLDPPPPRALRWIAHVLAAEELWQERLMESGRTVVVWPELTVGDCRTLAARTAARWIDLLAGADSARLATTVPYTNTKGDRFENTVRDILMHVALHGAHHRGQIVAEIRASGAEPPYLDYIHAVRQGLIA